MEKKIIASPTIWQQGPTKIFVYNDEENGKHKEPHIHVKYQNESEGAIRLKDGIALNGDLPPNIKKWCKKFVKRFGDEILKMMETKKYYRLDRPNQKNNKKKSNTNNVVLTEDNKEWYTTRITDVVQVANYTVRIWFRDGSVKDLDLEKVIYSEPYKTTFQAMIDDPSIVSEVENDIGGISWDDQMDFSAEWLYENAENVIQL